MSVPLEQALQALYGHERRRDDLGLDGTRALLEALGNPELSFTSVHVAGTNGKGSVAALIERVLRATGLRTGLFTSPHLVDFRERIRVNGRWADHDRLERRLAVIQGLPVGRDRTFFEVTTALAFDAFAADNVDWAVIEVGLGGRLDCTNVVKPEVSVITGIALDHTEILGSTLAAVAREKAGIVKTGVPLVSGPLPDEAAEVVVHEARVHRAPHLSAGQRVQLGAVLVGPAGARFEAVAPPWGPLDLTIALRGRHQVENAVTALATLSLLAEQGLEISAAAVREGFAMARWPGRLEPCPIDSRLWWDAAHNADGMSRLVRTWTADLELPPPSVLVFAASRDKDLAAMLASLRSLAPSARLVVTRARNERAADPEALAETARELGWEPAVLPDVPSAVRHALAAVGRGRALLAGSMFAVGEAMETLGSAPAEQQ